MGIAPSSSKKSPQDEAKMSEVAEEENNTGSRVLVGLAVLGFAWGSGYLAGKGYVPAPALLGGEKPTLLSKPTHRFIWLQSFSN